LTYPSGRALIILEESRFMIHNPVIDTLMNRKSIRKFTPQQPSDEVLHTIVRAGQQAPFAYQLCSVLLSRKIEENPFNAPLSFIICVDAHRFELIMDCRGWKIGSNDLSLLLLGIQDAALLAENMVTAAESLGLGSCFLGAIPNYAAEIIQQYKLPTRVFPLVGLAMGYPAINPPTRPRYPLSFTLFENEYPELDEVAVQEAMGVMDEGYLAQDYYRKANYIIPLKGDRLETYTFENYSWTEHISRKLGLWQKSPHRILTAFEQCGFHIPSLRQEVVEEDED
jgi:nitroreductase